MALLAMQAQNPSTSRVPAQYIALCSSSIATASMLCGAQRQVMIRRSLSTQWELNPLLLCCAQQVTNDVLVVPCNPREGLPTGSQNLTVVACTGPDSNRCCLGIQGESKHIQTSQKRDVALASIQGQTFSTERPEGNSVAQSAEAKRSDFWQRRSKLSPQDVQITVVGGTVDGVVDGIVVDGSRWRRRWRRRWRCSGRCQCTQEVRQGGASPTSSQHACMHDGGRAGRRLTCRCERSRQPVATCNVGAHAAPPTRAYYFSTRWPCTSAVGGGGWGAHQNGCKWKSRRTIYSIRVNHLAPVNEESRMQSDLSSSPNLVSEYTQNPAQSRINRVVPSISSKINLLQMSCSQGNDSERTQSFENHKHICLTVNSLESVSASRVVLYLLLACVNSVLGSISQESRERTSYAANFISSPSSGGGH